MTTSSLRLQGFVYLSVALLRLVSAGSALCRFLYLQVNEGSRPGDSGSASSLGPGSGYDLWEKGQLRMPAEGLFLTADLRERGKNDRAILLDVPDGKEIATYVLIAGEEEGSWSRLFLARLGENTQMRWSAGGRPVHQHFRIGVNHTVDSAISDRMRAHVDACLVE